MAYCIGVDSKRTETEFYWFIDSSGAKALATYVSRVILSRSRDSQSSSYQLLLINIRSL